MALAHEGANGTCPCCLESQWREVHRDIAACRKCGHQIYDHQADSAELAQIYQKEFFEGAKYRDYAGDKAIIQANFRARLDSVLGCIEKAIIPAASQTLLEIGCAYGFFLELARPRFGEVQGIDIAAEATAHAREILGLQVITADPLQQTLGRQFDVVCMWDTIEHLARPDLYVERAVEWLKPGGFFFATTGDSSSWAARLQGRKWRLYDPPQHVHFFSPHSLGLLLGRYGLSVQEVKTCTFRHSIEQIVHGLGVHEGREPGVLGWLCRLIHPWLPNWLARLTIPINLGDIFLIVGRKG